MRLVDRLPRELVLPRIEAADLETCFRTMMKAVGRIFTGFDSDTMIHDLLEREKLQSTSIGNSVAVPHIRQQQFRQQVVVVGRSENGLPFKVAQGTPPVKAVFLILQSSSSTEGHFPLLFRIGRMVQRQDFLPRFMAAPDSSLYDALLAMEQDEFPTDRTPAE